MTRDSLPSLGEVADTTAHLAELRTVAEGILGQAWSVERSRRLLGGPHAAFDDELWQIVTDLGWPDVLVGESLGGGGAGIRELCVLAEAVGAVVAPIPLGMTAAAGWCERRCSSGIALVLDGTAEIMPQGLAGTWPMVPYGAAATRLLVLGNQRDGSMVLAAVDGDAPGVQREALTPLDHNPAARITLNGAPFAILERGIEARRRYARALARTRLGIVAELVGVASAANHAAAEYAKVRVAFGRPIGTFQAVKHRLVDQRTKIEVARALLNRAADACEGDHLDAQALVSLAAFWALDTLRAVPEGATQVFGGVGYTWEHEAHVYLRRAATLSASLGPRVIHRSVVTDWLTARSRSQR